MSAPRDRPLDALALARNKSLVERSFPLAGFARLRDRLAEATGGASARIAFCLEGQIPAARLTVQAEVVLTCRRCLGPVYRKVESDTLLVFADEATPELPEDREVVGGDPRKLDLAALVEDELLLSLPIVPQHDAGEACVLQHGAVQPAGKSQALEMRRPFAGLKDLLKH